MTISDLRNLLEQQKGGRQHVLDDLDATTERLKDHRRDLIRHEQAREVIRAVALLTQQQLQVHIGDVTTLALEAVYDDPYQLQADFCQRRNKTECDLFFTRGGERVDPLDASGGGAVDVAAFALRVASWSMRRPRSRALLVFDEPLKHLSSDKMPLAGEMLKQISARLGLQMLIVTHSEELAEAADRTFRVTKRRNVSRVEAS